MRDPICQRIAAIMVDVGAAPGAKAEFAYRIAFASKWRQLLVTRPRIPIGCTRHVMGAPRELPDSVHVLCGWRILSSVPYDEDPQVDACGTRVVGRTNMGEHSGEQSSRTRTVIKSLLRSCR